MSPRRRWRRSDWLGPLGLRLTGAAVTVALVSVVLMAALTVLLADIDLTSAGHEHEATSTRAIVDSVRSTYLRDPDWKPADLASTKDLAHAIGVGVVLNVNGKIFMKVPAPASGGTSKTAAVTESGRTIGVLTITFARGGLLPEELAFRRSIERSVLLAAVLALLVAIAAALYGSRWLVMPLRSLIAATRRLASGDRSSRVGEVPMTGAMAELATAFDSMAEKLEREDVLRQNIVADLAHELRTPLSILQGQLEALAVGVSPLDQDAVASLSEEVARLARLIEDLQVLSSAEAAGLSLQMVSVDLAGIASSATARLAARFVEKGVDLAVSFSPTEVRGDTNRLEQVVVNLLSNAVKFTPPDGKVTITVDNDGRRGRLVVTDTGRGIPLEEQGHIFERFYRGSRSGDTFGTGVGLAVVAALVTAHGGTVTLESRTGIGSAFTIYLPQA